MDKIEQQIMSDGFIPNDDIWRKWTVSQMLRHGVKYKESGFEEYFINNKPYRYIWTTALSEIYNISATDTKTRNTMYKFFDKNVICEMITDFETKCKPEQKKIASEFKQKFIKAKNYRNLYNDMKTFLSKVKFPRNMEKPEAWKNAFIGTGIYYTMVYLTQFENYTFPENEMYSTLAKINQLTKTNKAHYRNLFPVMYEFLETNKNRGEINNVIESTTC